MLPRLQLMTTLLVSCTALHVVPTRSLVKPAVTRRAALLVMDEENEVYSLPFTNVTAAAADIKEVLAAKDAEATAPSLAALTDEKNDIDAALLHGYDAEKVKRLADVEAMLAAAAALEATRLALGEATTAPAPSPEVVSLTNEKKDLDAALLHGYDAEKVKRLAEVEALLAAADGTVPEARALSPEEAAKVAWLAARTRPSWGAKRDAE